MPSLRFGEFLPDQPALGNPGVLRATNVFPGASSFLPVPSWVSATNAIDDRPRGAIQARDTSGSVFQYAGDESKLYQNASGAWTDRSISGGYSTGSEERWEFVAWKNKLLATNFTDSPQSITFGGSNFADLTTDFRFRHIAVVRDFVVGANTADVVDGNVPSRVRWSAFNDETDWTVSASTLADFQDLKTAAVQRIFGGEFGVIFQRDSVWRMTFVGAPVVFQFDEVVPAVGLIAPGAAARAGDLIYFLSDKGFFVLSQGANAQPIGAGKVDRFVLDDIDNANLHRISSVADPQTQRVFWAYPGSGSTGGRPNRIVVYDVAFNRWSLIEEDLELLWQAGGTATTIDSHVGVLIDATDIAVDSSRWVGGAPEIGMFDENFESGFFDGPPMAAMIETREFEFVEGAHSRLNGFRALIDGGTVTARVGTRNSQAGAVTYGASLSAGTENRITPRTNARYHRFELTLSDEWSEAIGIQVEKRDLKRGGRRG